MEERLEDIAARFYAQLCERVHTKKHEKKELTFLKSLMNIACIILVLGMIMMIGIIVDRVFKISQNEDISDMGEKIEVSLYN